MMDGGGDGGDDGESGMCSVLILLIEWPLVDADAPPITFLLVFNGTK